MLLFKLVFLSLLLQCHAVPAEERSEVRHETDETVDDTLAKADLLPALSEAVAATLDAAEAKSDVLPASVEAVAETVDAAEAKAELLPASVDEASEIVNDAAAKAPLLPALLEEASDTVEMKAAPLDPHPSFLQQILGQTQKRPLSILPSKPVANEDDLDHFYVITAIFNPQQYESRYALYHDFARHIKSSGAQLVTIEAIFPSLGQTEFKVTNATNPNHFQVESDSVYWVKEDLINLAVSRLPPSARWVSWLDADIYFHNSNWIRETISALDRHVVVQMFKYAHFLNAQGEILRTDYSFGYSLVNGKPLLGMNSGDWYPHPGYGWAMTREDFLKARGLPNFDIVGNGDLYFAYTLVNHMSDVIEKDLDEEYKQGMRQEAQKTYEILTSLAGKTSRTVAGFVPVSISHRWHGARKDRGYVDRLNILVAHDFNYFTDTSREENGLLKFLNETGSLEQDVKCYFENRNEDDQKTEANECHSEHYKLFLGSLIQKPTASALSTCNCDGAGHHRDGGLPGHYYGKTYTYYTTQHYHNVLDTKALETIVRLVKS